MVTTAYYPPQIEGKIPAQYGTVLRIPFSVGYAPNQNSILYARIKTIVNNMIVGDVLSTNKFENENNVAIFNIPNGLLKEQQYYKIQLSWDKNIYSTVGVFRYTSEPSVIITAFNNATDIHRHLTEYIATYTNDDSGEQPYQYRFILVKNGKVIESSGLINYEANSNSAMRYQFKTNLLPQQIYKIQCLVYTTGGLTVYSPMYSVKMQEEYTPSIKINVQAISNLENGTISFIIQPENEQVICGKYRILRASSLDDFNTWDTIADICININTPWEVLQDKTVQQGVGYKYAIQQYNNNVFATKIETDIVICDFEDAFLFDGKRQLKIRFNPKVSSFKTVNLEQKIDTIGSRYPFIFRNGYTQYKEFPISGLISLLMDDNNDFMLNTNDYSEKRTSTNEKAVKTKKSLTNLTGDNFANERQFKLEVLDWLTNGQPKLFRSPAEGNYIVRLMNTSLSPDDTLGRMLHTFSTTAYEIAPYNFDTLLSFNLVEKIYDNLMFLNSNYINLLDYREQTKIPINYGKLISIKNSAPGAQFCIELNGNHEINIEIGLTGQYEYIADGTDYISAVTINPKYAGNIEILQYGKFQYPIVDSIKVSNNEGESLINVSVVDYEFKECFSQYYASDGASVTIDTSPIIKEDQGYKSSQIMNISILHIENRHIIETDTLPEQGLPIYIYKKGEYYYFPSKEGIIDEADATKITTSLNLTCEIDGNIIDFAPQSITEDDFSKVSHQGRIIYTSNENEKFLPEKIVLGNGLIAHMYYTVRMTSYESAV